MAQSGRNRNERIAVTEITRRALLAGTVFAAAATTSPKRTAANAPAAGNQAAGFYRYRIGAFEMTAVHDGVWNRPIDEQIVRNVPFEEVRKALAESFLPTDKLPLLFTALLVNTGSKLVLLDTGTGGQLAPTAGTMSANLAAAGIDPKSVDVIVISHFHPDHINGIKTKDNELVFANAEILVPAPEWAFWMDDGKMSAAPQSLKGNFLNVRRVFGDIAKNVRRYEPGQEVAPGVTSIGAYGHTPGHTAFAVSSGNESMLLLSDTTSHPSLFARNPEWQGSFDMDGNVAVDTRKKLLDRAAADRMLVQGYHFPFPASGYIAHDGKGYNFVPVMWQASL
jgi:glyoxylase-like metal-dependent hydrolase (beta-lactamase superfamily II)